MTRLHLWITAILALAVLSLAVMLQIREEYFRVERSKLEGKVESGKRNYEELHRAYRGVIEFRRQPVEPSQP